VEQDYAGYGDETLWGHQGRPTDAVPLGEIGRVGCPH
jgi:hypothetical protein